MNVTINDGTNSLSIPRYCFKILAVQGFITAMQPNKNLPSITKKMSDIKTGKTYKKVVAVVSVFDM